MTEPKKQYDHQLLDDLCCYRFGPIWDGNVNSKALRDRLADLRLIERECGFQFLTQRGVRVLEHMGLLNQDTWRKR